jgi:hypothetical protein
MDNVKEREIKIEPEARDTTIARHKIDIVRGGNQN